MRLAFICQAVDPLDPNLGTTVRWIELFSSNPSVERVVVLCLRKGEWQAPQNVEIQCFGARSRVARLFRFYACVVSILLKERIDCFFIYMDGPYAPLLWPISRLLGRPLYQWKSHPVVTRLTKFSVRHCLRFAFTNTEHSFPLQSPKILPVGCGIDVALFQRQELPLGGDVVTTGRVTPRKRLDLMIGAIAFCKKEYGQQYTLDIYGPVDDEGYRRELEERAQVQGVTSQVRFKGAVSRDQIPNVLNAHSLFLSCAGTALDKSILEAMACERLVLTTNEVAGKDLPPEILAMVYVERQDEKSIAEKLHTLLTLSRESALQIGRKLRDYVSGAFDDRRMIDQMVSVMTEANRTSPKNR